MDIWGVIVSALQAGLGVQASTFALAGVGLNLQFGYAGLLDFGYVAFMMAGAYGVAITVDAGGSWWLGVLVGIGLSVGVGLLFGLPSLRLRGDYLAIVTIATGEILRLVARSERAEGITNGVFGIREFSDTFHSLNPFSPGSYGIGDITFSHRALWVMTAAWVLVALFSFMVWALMRSPWGRVLRSIREDEEAARSLGKNVFSFKLQALILGGIIGSFAGLLRAADFDNVRPDSFTTLVTFVIYTIVILGGPGRVLGPIVGAIIYWFVISLTDGILKELVVNDIVSKEFLTDQDIAAVRFALVGLALMLLAAFRPQGILGKKEDAGLDEY